MRSAAGESIRARERGERFSASRRISLRMAATCGAVLWSRPSYFSSRGADEILDLNGRVGQGGKAAPAVGGELGNEIVAPVEADALGVGEHPAGPGKAAGWSPSAMLEETSNTTSEGERGVFWLA